MKKSYLWYGLAAVPAVLGGVAALIKLKKNNNGNAGLHRSSKNSKNIWDPSEFLGDNPDVDKDLDAQKKSSSAGTKRKNRPATASQGSKSANGKKIYTGAKGGKYYLNEKGSKVYISKKA